MTLDPKFNKLPKVTDFGKASAVFQQNFEEGFRTLTGQELVSEIKDYIEITGTELEPIASGLLPTPQADQIRTMDVVGPGTWTHPTLAGGASLLAGQTGKLFFSGGVWSLRNVVDLPKAPVANEGGDSTDIAASQAFVTFVDLRVDQSIVRESNKTSLEVIENIVKDKVTSNKIVPNKTPLSLYNGAGAGTHRTLSTWYFGKSLKLINSVGFYFFKDSSVLPFTNFAKGKIQVLVKRGATNYVLLNKEISYAELIKCQSTGYSGNISHYEYISSIQEFQLLAGDSLYVNFTCNEGVYYFTGSNTSLGSGEWNENNLSYRFASMDEDLINYIEVPVNERTGNASALPVNFYYNDFTLQKTDDYSGTSSTKFFNQLGANKLKNDVTLYVDDAVYASKNIVNINPVFNPSFYALYNGGGAGTHTHIFAWYFAKSTKKIDKVGVYAYKNSTVLPFTSSATGRVQVLVKNAADGSSVKIADVTLSYGDLLNFQGSTNTPNILDNEILISVTPTNISIGDVIYVNLEVLEGVFYFLGNISNIGIGEWARPSDNLGERGSSTSPTSSTIFVVPNYTGGGSTSVLPFRTYEAEKMLKIDTLKYAEKDLYSNSNTLYFNVDNFPVKLVTSNSYNSTNKEGQDTLLIICHGNGQLSSSMDGADPSGVFKSYAEENSIAWCVFKMQDSVPVKQGEYWESTNTGWGNAECHRRLKLVYQHLSQHFNFKKLIVLAGQSMGFATAQVADYMGYLPVKDLISIGGVMNGVVGRFSLASTEDRKNQIRSAFNLKNDGSEDELLLEKSQGYDSWKRNLIGEAKLQKSRLWFLMGTNDDSYAGFGGNTQRDLMISSLQKAGGFIKFQQYSSEYHSSSELWTKLIELGWAEEIFN